ncbi:MAG: asparagine synthase-related protein [Chloroflexota bacterium]|nr:asparagine synthase-related protein [Chloroflexota bacterium]
MAPAPLCADRPEHPARAVSRLRSPVALNGDGGDESFAGYDRYRHLVRSLVAVSLKRESGCVLTRPIVE